MKRILVVLLLLSASAYAQDFNDVRLTVVANPAGADQAAGTLPVRATIINDSDRPLQGVQLVFSRGMGEPVFTEPGWTCTPRPDSPNLTPSCSRQEPVPAQSQITVDFVIRFPLGAGRYKQTVILLYQYGIGDQRSRLDAFDALMFKPFVVRNTNDSGPGSLREAITAINSDQICIGHPCRITFAMDGQTINLLSPLPRVTGVDVEIDGTTQPDTNPLGPDVEIMGAGLRQGNGLELASQIIAVRGLALGYFPGDGLVILANENEWTQAVIEKNYIGVDATGSHARINLGRGITLTEGTVSVRIADNVISGNHRSGIFVNTVRSRGFSLAKVVTILNNRIGVAAHSESAIPNGASGVFVGPRADQVLVEGNVIAHNAHFGVSISRDARFVSVLGNRMFRNAFLGVDIALDGPTPPRENNAVPTLLTARYDAATNKTTITGRGAGPANFAFHTYRFELYANGAVDADGYAETEQVLGRTLPNDDGTFSLTVDGDLRGMYISAVGIHFTNFDGSLVEDTSEISRAIRVE